MSLSERLHVDMQAFRERRERFGLPPAMTLPKDEIVDAITDGVRRALTGARAIDVSHVDGRIVIEYERRESP